MKNFNLLSLILVIGLSSCVNSSNNPGDDPIPGPYDYGAPFASTAPVIDGIGDEAVWKLAEWKPIDKVWLGGGTASQSNLNPPPAGTYSGRYKIVWTEDRLYYLVEIKDTLLVHGRDPYVNPENDDCLELFINSNGLGGLHENNNVAIAYHMKLDEENAMDYVSGQSGSAFKNGYIKRNHHLNYKIGNLDLANRKSIDGLNIYTWEVEMKIFPATLPIDDNPDTNPPAIPINLTENQIMGFAVAYCNAGTTGSREYFMGSMDIPGANKNVAYQNASVFAKIKLIKTEEDWVLETPVYDGTSSVVSLVQAAKVTDVNQHTYASIKTLVDMSIKLAGGLEGIVKPGDTVVLKPNIITTIYSWAWPSGIKIPAGAPNAKTPTAPNGIVTDWRVVQAVAENVRAIIGSTGKILVMESSGKGNPASGTEAQYANVGYTAANLTAVDEILTLDFVGGDYWTNPNPAALPDDVVKIKLDNPVFDTPYKQSDYGGNPTSPTYTSYDGQGNYYVAKQMYEADAIICIPVLKLHGTAGTTGAIKNISIGAAPPRIYGNSANDIGRNFRIPHSEANGIHKWIADYYSVMPADFVVMDALRGVDQGPLPPAGDAAAVKKINSILASKDGLAIDVVMSNIIKVDYTKVGHLSYLTERGKVGTKQGKTLFVRGEPKYITVVGNKKVHDLREGVSFSGSISTGLGGNIGTTRLSTAQLAKPTVAITSAEFSGQNLNLTLTASANTVKVDVFIDDQYINSVYENINNITIDASKIIPGSRNIKVYAYTNYMVYAEASVTAVK